MDDGGPAGRGDVPHPEGLLLSAPLQIFHAWSDELCVNEGTAVRVSLIAFGATSPGTKVRLDGQEVARIQSWPRAAPGAAADDSRDGGGRAAPGAAAEASHPQRGQDGRAPDGARMAPLLSFPPSHPSAALRRCGVWEDSACSCGTGHSLRPELLDVDSEVIVAAHAANTGCPPWPGSRHPGRDDGVGAWASRTLASAALRHSRRDASIPRTHSKVL